MKYSEVKLGENFNQDLEEWSVEKHTEQSSTDAYGIINFQGGSHSYRAKVCAAIRSTPNPIDHVAGESVRASGMKNKQNTPNQNASSIDCFTCL